MNITKGRVEMISVSDEIKLRADIAARLISLDGIRKLTTAVSFADEIVDNAIKKSQNIKKGE
jgi:hypothetical protein